MVGIVVVVPIRVPGAGVVKKLEAIVGEPVSAAPQRTRVGRAAGAVPIVPAVVQAAAVVKEREKTDDLGVCTRPGREQEAIAFDSPPVAGAVEVAVRRSGAGPVTSGQRWSKSTLMDATLQRGAPARQRQTFPRFCGMATPDGAEARRL